MYTQCPVLWGRGCSITAGSSTPSVQCCGGGDVPSRLVVVHPVSSAAPLCHNTEHRMCTGKLGHQQAYHPLVPQRYSVTFRFTRGSGTISLAGTSGRWSSSRARPCQRMSAPFTRPRGSGSVGTVTASSMPPSPRFAFFRGGGGAHAPMPTFSSDLSDYRRPLLRLWSW